MLMLLREALRDITGEVVKLEYDLGVAQRHPFIRATFGSSGSRVNVEMPLLKLLAILALGLGIPPAFLIDVIESVFFKVSLILLRLASLEFERLIDSPRSMDSVLADLDGGAREWMFEDDLETLSTGFAVNFVALFPLAASVLFASLFGKYCAHKNSCAANSSAELRVSISTSKQRSKNDQNSLKSGSWTFSSSM